ncbi:MAG: hypothetical protein IRY83_04810, partial [Chloroflexi bacterium]|nr:hypothetical protein [Chloroflexota bacterium]
MEKHRGSRALTRRSMLVLSLSAVGSLLASCSSASAPPTAAPTAPIASPTPAAVSPTAAAPSSPTVAAASPTAAQAAATATVAATPSAAVSNLRWTPKAVSPPKRYSPIVEITQNWPYGGNKYKPGESDTDNVWTRFIEQQMGLRFKFKWTYTNASADQQKWALALASGDLPEFMSAWIPLDIYTKLLDAGKLEDITDVWNSVASDLTKTKKGYPQDPMWRPVVRKDRIYGIPFNRGPISDTIMWIRQDWLDAVGMPMPTTLDALYEVGLAFVKKGLAKMGIAVAKEIITYNGSLDPIFGAFGVMPKRWLKDSSGKLVYGTIQPAVRDALALLRKWYADGMISKEFYTISAGGDNGINSLLLSGKAGITFSPYWWYGYVKLVHDNDPKANFVFADPPAGPGGKRGRAGSNIAGDTTGFLKGIDHVKVEAILNQINWHLERAANWADNFDYGDANHFWFEGYDYVWDGDTIKAGPYNTYVYGAGGEMPVFCYPAFQYDWNQGMAKIQAKDPKTLNAMEVYLTQDPYQKLGIDAYNRTFETRDIAIPNQFWGVPTKTMLTANALLTKLEDQMLVNVITGQAPLNAWDDFVKQWRSQGGDKITEEVNAWYK